MIAIDKVFFAFCCGRSGQPLSLHDHTPQRCGDEESTVETATHLLARRNPRRTFRQNCGHAAMGMAASTTETPVTRLSAPQSLQPSSTAAGISPSRMRQ